MTAGDRFVDFLLWPYHKYPASSGATTERQQHMTDSTAPAIKPGVQTSEFWTHLLTVAVSLITVLAAVVHPGFKVPASVAQWIAPVAILAALGSQVVYTICRNGLKKSSLVEVEAWAKSVAPEALGAIEQLKPLLESVPALTGRVNAVEGAVSDVSGLADRVAGVEGNISTLAAKVALAPAPAPAVQQAPAADSTPQAPAQPAPAAV